MVATPWVDCDGKLLVDASGSPLFCEEDPCAGGGTDPPETHDCITAPASWWTGTTPGPIAVSFAGNAYVGGSSDILNDPECFCREFFGTFSLPYVGSGTSCLASGTWLHRWQQTFTGLNSNACTDPPFTIPGYPWPNAADIFVEARYALDPALGLPDCTGSLFVNLLMRPTYDGNQVFYPGSGYMISIMSAGGPSITPPDSTYGRFPDGTLDFVNGFNLVLPATHSNIGFVANGCPDATWHGDNADICYYTDGRWNANLVSRLEPV